jgi:hypothetical protein
LNGCVTGPDKGQFDKCVTLYNKIIAGKQIYQGVKLTINGGICDILYASAVGVLLHLAGVYGYRSRL